MLMLYSKEAGDVEFNEITGFDRFYHTVASMFLSRLMTKEQAFSPANGDRCLKIAAGISHMYSIVRPKDKDTKKEILKLLDEKLINA